MKNQTKNKKAKVEETIIEVTNNEAPKMKGRPVNQASKRQQRITELQAKREAGMLRKGRPVVEGSKRQARLLEMEARKAANGGVAKRGRPKMNKVEDQATEIK
jgi:hypothetical protein